MTSPNNWIEAPFWPKEWANKNVWEYREGAEQLGVIPHRASADSYQDDDYYQGVWWMLREAPEIPDVVALRAARDTTPADAGIGEGWVIYSDGACSGNPGPGGWGAYITKGGLIDPRSWYDGAAKTTNNIMELTAAIEGLYRIPKGDEVEVRTDSKYVIDGITSWIHGWKKRGWKNSKQEPVKNKELWMRLDELASERKVKWTWVKGHAGEPGNEKADELANLGMAPFK